MWQVSVKCLYLLIFNFCRGFLARVFFCSAYSRRFFQDQRESLFRSLFSIFWQKHRCQVQALLWYWVLTYYLFIFVTSSHFKLHVYAMKSSPCPSLGVVYFYNKNPQYNKLSFWYTEDSTSFFKFLCYWYLLSIIYSNWQFYRES